MYTWAPTLDASAIFSLNKSISTPHNRRIFAKALVAQLRKHGFARIRNHGVAPATMKSLFRCHQEFFDLPLSQKMTVRHPGGEAPARGYSPWAFEKTAILRPDLHTAQLYSLGSSPRSAMSPSPSPSSLSSGMTESLRKSFHSPSRPLLDAREQFAVGPPSDFIFPTPQVAETILPNFNSDMTRVHQALGETCSKLVDTIEFGLNAPVNSISGRTAGGGGAELNLNYYPSVEREVISEEEGELEEDDSTTTAEGQQKAAMRRIWPHSDLGVVSALIQDGVGANGLELEVRDTSGSTTNAEGESSNKTTASTSSDAGAASPQSSSSSLPPSPTNRGTGVFAPVSVEQQGDIVLLVSDTLERWTNGYLRAAVHRVGLPPAPAAPPSSLFPGDRGGSSPLPPPQSQQVVPARRSAVMFFRAPPTASLGPLPHFVSSQNPAMYESVTAAEYLKKFNRKLY